MSQPTRLTLWTCAAMDVPVEFKRVDAGKGEHRTPEFLAMNPNARFPVLVEGDFVVFESNAICKYIINRTGRATPLYPSDVRVRAHVDSWLDWKHGSLRSGCAGIVRRRVMKHLMKDYSQHSMALNFKEIPEEREARELMEALSVVDAALRKTKAFLVQDTTVPTLADMAVFEEVEQLRMLPSTEPPPFGSDIKSKFPAVHDWLARVRTAWPKAEDIHKDLNTAIANLEKGRAAGKSKF